jgi:hypothetical protein
MVYVGEGWMRRFLPHQEARVWHCQTPTLDLSSIPLKLVELGKLVQS